MDFAQVKMQAARDPIQALLDAPEPGVLAVIAGVEGPSYRPLGAMMSVLGPEMRAGTLSSGCIESDITLHALEAQKSGQPNLVRYGHGSPFLDIRLPCGGGLDIALLPNPDRDALGQVAANQSARKPCRLEINLDSGAMHVHDGLPDGQATHRDDRTLAVAFAPAIQFLVFGKGPEAGTFAALVQSAGYPNLLLSPDDETLGGAAALGCATRQLTGQVYPKDVQVDDRTAIVLFFHDHDWEPPLLAGALETDAFYIGSQGSQRARDARLATLREMGIGPAQLDRLTGPIGLVPSARDPGTLAVSVLAEVLARGMKQT